MERKKTIRLYLMACVSALMFGLSYVVTKGALDHVEPMQLMTYRMSVALVALLVAVAFGWIKVDYRGKPIRYLVLIGLAQPVIYAFFETWGIKNSSVSESAIILAMIPVAATVLSTVVFKQKNSKREYGFILLSFLGVVVANVLSGDFSVSGKLLGYALLIGAVLSGATYTVLSNQYGGQFTSAEVTLGMTVMGFVVFHAFYFGSGYTLGDYVSVFTTPRTLFPVLYLGVCCSMLCYVIMNYVLCRLSVPKATALAMNLMTVTGIVTGILFQGDSFTVAKGIGIVLIVVGVVGINLEKKEEPCVEQMGEL